jgi:hypothetical protein
VYDTKFTVNVVWGKRHSHWVHGYSTEFIQSMSITQNLTVIRCLLVSILWFTIQLSAIYMYICWLYKTLYHTPKPNDYKFLCYTLIDCKMLCHTPNDRLQLMLYSTKLDTVIRCMTQNLPSILYETKLDTVIRCMTQNLQSMLYYTQWLCPVLSHSALTVNFVSYT